MVFEKATKVKFRNVEDLATVWCEYAEMELRHESVAFLSFLPLSLFWPLTSLSSIPSQQLLPCSAVAAACDGHACPQG